MRPRGAPKIVLLGMMTKMPVAGVVWQTIHYLLGFRRLGYDIHYVEAHARTPSMFMETAEDDGSGRAAAFIAGVMRRFDLDDRWAFHALHDDGRCYGMSETSLRELYGQAALLINLHGGTQPLSEHASTGRLVYLETDPVRTEVELSRDLQATIDFLEAHSAFFTFGENYGRPECGIPVSDRFDLKPTRQPVVLELWENRAPEEADAFTTIGNWKQPWRDIQLEGELYRWSKHHEFLKFLDLPRRTARRFELALSGCPPEDRRRLEENGWHVRDALALSGEPDAYRGYIAASRGEFTVAKDQNVRLRSGWFSDRSATYLAAGRPVITQDTAFGSVLPTGRGLFAFSDLHDILAAVDRIESDYGAHARAASEIARECFHSDVVLGRLLEDVGLPRSAGAVPRSRSAPAPAPPAFPSDLDLRPASRHPTRLSENTLRTVLGRPVPPPLALPAWARDGARAGACAVRPHVSVVVVTRDGLPFTRLCLESLVSHTAGARHEVIVVDNGSTDGTPDYLLALSRELRALRLQFNGRNLGFAAASNLGLAMAAGDVLVLLNNDTIPPPGWLDGLLRHLEDEEIGLVGPRTNRASNEAGTNVRYGTYGELLRFARAHGGRAAPAPEDVRTLLMFCVAMRREVFERVGPLDERFETGMFEDDDYAMRVRQAGYRVVLAHDAFVHHFGQATLGELARDGELGRLFHRNRRRFERKWGVRWRPHARSPDPEYDRLVARIRMAVGGVVPAEATVLVVSKGDDRLLRLGRRTAWHFPRDESGDYAGFHPAGSDEAIAELESQRARGGAFLLLPGTAEWWLDHYRGFRDHLERRYRLAARMEGTCTIYSLGEPAEERDSRPPTEGGRDDG